DRGILAAVRLRPVQSQPAPLGQLLAELDRELEGLLRLGVAPPPPGRQLAGDKRLKLLLERQVVGGPVEVHVSPPLSIPLPGTRTPAQHLTVSAPESSAHARSGSSSGSQIGVSMDDVRALGKELSTWGRRAPPTSGGRENPQGGSLAGEPARDQVA